MRSMMIDGERFFVFQDVCREIAGRVRFIDLRHVSAANHRLVKLPVECTVMRREIVVNEAGVEEMRAGLAAMESASGGEKPS